jgi:hypothetical protein
MSARAAGTASFDASGRRLKEGVPQDGAGMVGALQAAFSLPDELAGPRLTAASPPEPAVLSRGAMSAITSRMKGAPMQCVVSPDSRGC